MHMPRLLSRPRRSIGWLVLGLALGSRADAQGALDRLNQILGRDADGPVQVPSASPAPARTGSQATPARPVSGAAAVASTRPAPLPAGTAAGGIAYVDYGLLFRLHPVMQFLRVEANPEAIPVFVKDGVARELKKPMSVLQAEAEKKKALVQEREDVRAKYNSTLEMYNRMPRNASEVIRKLPKAAPPEVHKKAEEEFFKDKGEMREKLIRLGARMSELDAAIEGETRPGPALNEEYFRRIRADLDSAIRAEAAAVGAGMVLNLPSPSDMFHPVRNTTRPDARGTTNQLAEFLAVKLAPGKTGEDQGAMVAMLVRWQQTMADHPDFLPSDADRPSVLLGGHDLAPAVLERIWTSYKIGAAHIAAAKSFLAMGSRQ